MHYSSYVVQSTSPKDCKHVLYDRSWMIVDHYLLVYRCTFSCKCCGGANSHNLELSILLKIHILTSIHSRGHYARFCMEMDLTKKLIPSIKFYGITMPLKYEGSYLLCYRCCKCDH
ncbi:hypothetical protein GmHk_20G057013 [Glycine max]|nr:hypothetical protein GmHk_20G057013 [Glycine max]